MPQIETVDRSALPELLGWILTPSDRTTLPNPADLNAFFACLDYGAATWEGWRAHEGTRTTGAFLALLLPGATAIVMIPNPRRPGVRAEDQLAVSVTGLERLRSRRLYYAEALLEPQAAAQHTLVARLGFRRLTRLIYLETDPRRCVIASSPLPGEQWAHFSEQTSDELARTILETYEQSDDCPELMGVRPIEDVIASHRSVGRFDPRLWEIVSVEGRPAGCLLLAQLPLAPVVELVYMGVVPEFRRRGIGASILARARRHAAQLAARRISLAADERNAAALRLYARCGFRTIGARDAYWLRW